MSKVRKAALVFELLMAGVVVVWGLNYVNVKFGTLVWTPFAFTWVRFLLVAVISAVWLLFRRQPLPSGRDLLRYLLVGALGISVYQILFAVGDHDTTASATGFLLAVSPVFTVLYMALIRRQPHRLSQWLGVSLSLCGVGLLVIGQPASPFAPNPLLGDLLDVLAALTWAAYTVISQPLVEQHDPFEVMLWSTIFGFLVLSVALPVTGMPPVTGIPLASWLAVAFAVGPVTLFGLGVWQIGVRQLGPTAVSVYINAMPVVGAIAAHLALGEAFGWLEGLGAAVVLGGLLLTRRPAATARVAVGQPTVEVEADS
ncbi:MAG: DMT family transporter [Sulfobacillus sp.]